MNIKDYIILYLFKKWYNGYVLPFESSDEVVGKMSEPERTEYYRQARELLQNRAYILENQEATRKLMQKLAVSTTNDTERTAYRLTLKCKQEEHRKYMERASMYQKPNITNISNRL